MLGCFTKKEYTAVAEENVTMSYLEILFVFFRSLSIYNSHLDYIDNTVHSRHFCYQLPLQTNNTPFLPATASSLQILKFVRLLCKNTLAIELIGVYSKN